MTDGSPIDLPDIDVESYRASGRIAVIDDLLHRSERYLPGEARPRSTPNHDLAVARFHGKLAYAAARTLDNPPSQQSVEIGRRSLAACRKFSGSAGRRPSLCAAAVCCRLLFRGDAAVPDFPAMNRNVRRSGNPKPDLGSPYVHNVDRNALLGQNDLLADLAT